MPTFKDDSILIIAPGSYSTLAQLGLPESFTPARHRFKTRMFPAEKSGEWEPHKIRTKQTKPQPNGHGNAETNGDTEPRKESENEITLEEDTLTDEGAVWPITKGRITNWSCFFALMDYIYHNLNTPFHTAILVLAQPVWTPRELEKITQFFFEKFKTPAFAILDSAHAACYAFGVETACVVDLGADKADVSAVVDHLVNDVSRGLAVPDCGGETMTRRLVELLSPRGFTRDMCEQLKSSAICEVLPPNTPLPAAQATQDAPQPANPAAAASTGATGSGANQRTSAGAAGTAPLGPGQDTEMGVDDDKELEDNEGVLDVASIVTGGRMTEYLERKEKEKAEKQASRNSKKAADAAASALKPTRLKNSEKERNTFYYEDNALLDALKGSDMDSTGVAEARHALDEGPQKTNAGSSNPLSNTGNNIGPQSQTQAPRRELSVGTERFLAASGPLMENLGSAIYRTILSHPQANKRADLWNNLIIVGKGSAIKGFKEALVAALGSRFLISPSSATMFTSELPSNFSTPVATGANTPIHPHPHAPTHHSSGVNPLLLAATHAQAPNNSTSYLQTPGQQAHTPLQNSHRETHSGHGQTPTSIKLAKLPEYFSEWKDVGSEEAAFLGAQVAAKVIFVTDLDQRNKGFMTRSEYNDSGPSGIHEFSI